MIVYLICCLSIACLLTNLNLLANFAPCLSFVPTNFARSLPKYEIVVAGEFIFGGVESLVLAGWIVSLELAKAAALLRPTPFHVPFPASISSKAERLPSLNFQARHFGFLPCIAGRGHSKVGDDSS